MTEKKIGNILKSERIRAGLSVEEVSEMLVSKGHKATPSAIYNWENDISQPKPGVLLDMCQAYGIHDVLRTFGYERIYDDKDVILTQKETDLIKKYRTLDKYGTRMVDGVLDFEYTRCADPVFRAHEDNVRYINYYLTPASAGSGQILYHDVPVEQIAIPDEYDLRLVAYAVRANGDSMEPAFYDGDVLLVEPAVDLMFGEIGIFYVDGSGYVKKYGDGELLSLNPAYSPIRLTEDSRCMGRVVGKL